MGFMRDVKNIQDAGAAMSARSTADDAKMLVVVQLMQMGWPTLDQQAAAHVVNDWLKRHGLGGS